MNSSGFDNRIKLILSDRCTSSGINSVRFIVIELDLSNILYIFWKKYLNKTKLCESDFA